MTPRNFVTWLVALVAGSCLFAHSAPIHARKITAEDLATLRDLQGFSLSPDGKWIAVQVRQPLPQDNRYEAAWYVLPSQGGAPRRVADAGEPRLVTTLGVTIGTIEVEPPAWSPDSEWIAYLRADKGRVQVWRSRRDGSVTQPLTRNEGDVSSAVFSRDGNRLFFRTQPSRQQIDSALDKEGLAGFLYDSRFAPTFSVRPLLPQDLAHDQVSGRALSEVHERGHLLWVYEIPTRIERPATGSEKSEFDALRTPGKRADRKNVRDEVAVSAAGGQAWTEARNPQLQGGYAPLTIAAQPAGSPEVVVCEHPQCTSQSMVGVWWNREDEVVFLQREGRSMQERAFYAWRPADGRVRLVLRTHAFQTHEWQVLAVDGHLICFYEEPTRPRRLVAIELDTGTIKTLFDPNPQWTQFDLGGEPQRLEFRSPGGVDSWGMLVLPPDYRPGSRLPLIITTYRASGFLRGGIGDEYPVFPFAAEGYAVLCYDVPGMDYVRAAREGFIALQNYNRGPGDPDKRRVQEGLESAIAHLEKAGVIDADRVALTGLSFGAEAVSYGLFHMPRLAAAIASGGGYEPSSPFLHGPLGREMLAAWGLGSPSSPRWESLSLSRNADKVRAPLLLNVTDREMIAWLESFVSLQDAGRAVEMHVFPDEYHIKWQPAHRLAIYKRNIDWVNFWLQGKEDTHHSSVEQYVRWRKLRELHLTNAAKDRQPASRGRTLGRIEARPES